MAIRGEEGRDSLRKASGSWQMSCDPEVSEWGNPTHTKNACVFCMLRGQKTEDGGQRVEWSELHE